MILIFYIGTILCLVLFIYLICKIVKIFWQRNYRQQWRQIAVALIATLLLVIYFCRSFTTFKNVTTYLLETDKKIIKDVGQDKKDYIHMIPFHDETYNVKGIIWEEMVNNELFYDLYSEETSNFDERHSTYDDNYKYDKDVFSVEIDDLVKLAGDLYGSEILPATNKTIKEVEEAIPPLGDRMYADPEIFQNKFWLLVDHADSNSSSEYLYQIGRAADDAFKILINKKNASIKQLIFYSSMAVAFYLSSTEAYDEKADLSLTYYSISEIYMYLSKYVDFGSQDAKYKEHFLLMAEIFLSKAETEFEKEGIEDIHKKLPYFSCYYAEILYKYYIKYKSKKEIVVRLCFFHAQQFLDSPFSKEHTQCRKSCEDIKTNLLNKVDEKILSNMIS